MSFAGATAFANAEAECPNKINRVLPVVHFFLYTQVRVCRIMQ